MGISERLAALRRQRGLGAASAEATPLAERIRRLRPGSPPLARGCGGEGELARRLGATVQAPGLLLLERTLGWGEVHGRRPLREALKRPALPGQPVEETGGLIYLDTETTGLAGGSGTLVFLLGLARAEPAGMVTRQYLMTRFAGEAPMLQQAAAWVAGAQALVTYNGKTFDLPLLAARCRLAGVADGFAGLGHIDLLHSTRGAFARRWEDCTLGSAERRLLGLARRGDLPGAEAPRAWIDWVRRGDAARLPAVVRHNHWDLVSLALLLPLLGDVYRAPGCWGADTVGVARAWERAGRADHALELLLRQRVHLAESGLLELAGRLRAQGRWAEALAIWQPLAEAGSTAALERLAKYYEHVARDYPRALDFAQRLPGAARRVARLRRRLGGRAFPP